MEYNKELPTGYTTWFQLYTSIMEKNPEILTGYSMLMNNPEGQKVEGILPFKRYRFEISFLKAKVLDELYNNLPTQLELFSIQEGLVRLHNGASYYILNLSKKMEAITKNPTRS